MKKSFHIILSLIFIAGVAGVGYLSEGFRNWDVKTWFQTSEETHFESDSLLTSLKETNNIQVKVKKAELDSTFGSQTLLYSVHPSNYSDSIRFKVNYTDGSDVEDGILTILHDADKKEFTIGCNKVFFKQIIFTIYAAANEDVKAEINIDFKEKLTLSAVFQAVEGYQFKVTPIVDTTGGTVLVDKTVKNESFRFNASFVNKAMNYLREDSYDAVNGKSFDASPFTHAEGDELILSNTYYDYRIYDEEHGTEYKTREEVFKAATSYTYNGLNDAEVWRREDYHAEDFVESIFVQMDNLVMDLDTAEEREVMEYKKDFSYNMSIDEIKTEHFEELFDGENPVFDYSFSVNGESFSKSFGLSISSLDIKRISTNRSGLCF